MARTFNGSSDLLRAAISTALGGYPATIFAWGRSTDLARNQYAAILNNTNDPWNGYGLAFGGAGGGDPIFFLKFGYGSLDGAYVSGQWYAIGGRSNSTTQADVVVDGAVTAGTTTNIAWPPVAEVQIGGRLQPALDSPLAGSVAAVALWAAYLDDAEMMSLARGFPPRRVRPQALRFYAPLVRNLQATQDGNPSGAHSAWTTTGAPTVSEHPRSYGI